MLIDWFTVGAQVLNFLVLVWLMKRFLYQPILHAIDEREKRVAAELADADQKRAAAAQAEATFKKKNVTFDEERAELLRQATEEAQGERKRLLDEARQAADSLSAKRAESLRSETRQFHQTLRRQTQKEVFAISRKALGDLASVSLEERLVDVFTRRLLDLDGEAKTSLADALGANTEPAMVRTAFELSAEQQAAVQQVVNETFSADVNLRFEIAPNRVGGIELTTNGQKLAWSIADYLGAMEKRVGALLEGSDQPDLEPVPDATSASEPESAVVQS